MTNNKVIKKMLAILWALVILLAPFIIFVNISNLNNQDSIKQTEYASNENATSSNLGTVTIEDSGSFESSTSEKQFDQFNYISGDQDWIYGGNGGDSFWIPYSYRTDSLVGAYVKLEWTFEDANGDFELNDSLVFRNSNGEYIARVYVSDFYSSDTQVWEGYYGFYLYPEKYESNYGGKGNFNYGQNNDEGSLFYTFEIFFDSGDGNYETLDYCYFTWSVYPADSGNITNVSNVDSNTIQVDFYFNRFYCDYRDAHFYITINDGGYISSNEYPANGIPGAPDICKGNISLTFNNYNNQDFETGKTYYVKVYVDNYNEITGIWSNPYYVYGTYISFTYNDVASSSIVNISSSTNSVSFDLEYDSYSNNSYNIYYKEDDINGNQWVDSGYDVFGDGLYSVEINDLLPSTTYDFKIGVGKNNQAVTEIGYFSIRTIDQVDTGTIDFLYSTNTSITININFNNGSGIYSNTNNLYLDIVDEIGNVYTYTILENASYYNSEYTIVNLIPSKSYDIFFYTYDESNNKVIFDYETNINTLDTLDVGELFFESKTTNSITFGYTFKNGTGEYQYSDNLYYSIDGGQTLVEIETDVINENSNEIKYFTITDLNSATKYNIEFYSKSTVTNNYLKLDELNVRTYGENDEFILNDIIVDSSTSVTIVYEYYNGTGVSSDPDVIWYSLNGGEKKVLVNQPIEGENTTTINELNPNTNYQIDFFFYNYDNALVIESRNFTTLSINEDYGEINVSKIETNISKEYAQIVATYNKGKNNNQYYLYYSINNSIYYETSILLVDEVTFTLELNQLTPNTNYDLTFAIKENGNYINIGSYHFKTMNYEYGSVIEDSVEVTSNSFNCLISYFSEENVIFGIYYKDEFGNYIYTGVEVVYSGVYKIEISQLQPSTNYQFDFYLGPQYSEINNQNLIDFTYLSSIEFTTKEEIYYIIEFKILIIISLFIISTLFVFSIYFLVK